MHESVQAIQITRPVMKNKLQRRVVHAQHKV
jgi:hypothetical protein